MSETATLDPDLAEDADTLIAAMVDMAESGPEPGDMRAKDVIHRGDDEYPLPVVAGDIKSAGYAIIYDTKTGLPSLTNRNMLATQFKKVHEDGTRAFSPRPTVKPKIGKTKCLLHADDPNRAHWDDLGFPVCRKANLVNKFQRDRHMARRHKDEWAAILEERKEQKEEEEKRFQRELVREMHKKPKAAKA